MTIADVRAGATDEMGDQIRYIYGIKPPNNAIYVTDKRLVVRFADDPLLKSEQRKGLASLNPIRGEINGLIDGWRLQYKRSGLREKAARYDRRVADALIVALEHDVDSAETILTQIKQDIIEDRVSWARLEYLVSALLISFILITIVWLFASGQAYDLWRSAAAGALGAFFSIALSIRGRTILPDLRRTSNITDASLRVLIGFVAASVLMAFVSSRAVTVGMGDARFDSASTPAWLFALLIGFLAGFSERLVPDLLAKASASTVAAPPRPQQQPLPAAEAGRTAAARAAAAAAVPVAAAELQGSQAPSLHEPGQTADDPAPHEAAVDHCVCDVELEASEVTRDDELPAGSGVSRPPKEASPHDLLSRVAPGSSPRRRPESCANTGLAKPRARANGRGPRKSCATIPRREPRGTCRPCIC